MGTIDRGSLLDLQVIKDFRICRRKLELDSFLTCSGRKNKSIAHRSYSHQNNDSRRRHTSTSWGC